MNLISKNALRIIIIISSLILSTEPLNQFPQLWALDKSLAKNLEYCKENSVNDLCLTFSVSETSFGRNQIVDLIPNGSNIEVTDENKIRYIHLMAYHRNTLELKKQAEAFKQGEEDNGGMKYEIL
jgi:hypothetical protein